MIFLEERYYIRGGGGSVGPTVLTVSSGCEIVSAEDENS
jgi:hypothetical protein